jgi:hypothetical protein
MDTVELGDVTVTRVEEVHGRSWRPVSVKRRRHVVAGAETAWHGASLALGEDPGKVPGRSTRWPGPRPVPARPRARRGCTEPAGRGRSANVSFRKLGKKALVRKSLRLSARGRRLGIASLAVLSFAAVAIGTGAKPASADSAPVFLQDYATGLCLTAAGTNVYTAPCLANPAASSQQWYISVTGSSAPNVALQNVESGLWLDSNSAGDLYTNTGNGDANQSWVELYPNDDGEFAFQDVATGLWLDSDTGSFSGGSAYTSPGNGGPYQSWSLEN